MTQAAIRALIADMCLWRGRTGLNSLEVVDQEVNYMVGIGLRSLEGVGIVDYRLGDERNIAEGTHQSEIAVGADTLHHGQISVELRLGEIGVLVANPGGEVLNGIAEVDYIIEIAPRCVAVRWQQV